MSTPNMPPSRCAVTDRVGRLERGLDGLRHDLGVLAAEFPWPPATTWIKDHQSSAEDATCLPDCSDTAAKHGQHVQADESGQSPTGVEGPKEPGDPGPTDGRGGHDVATDPGRSGHGSRPPQNMGEAVPLLALELDGLSLDEGPLTSSYGAITRAHRLLTLVGYSRLVDRARESEELRTRLADAEEREAKLKADLAASRAVAEELLSPPEAGYARIAIKRGARTSSVDIADTFFREAVESRVGRVLLNLDLQLRRPARDAPRSGDPS